MLCREELTKRDRDLKIIRGSPSAGRSLGNGLTWRFPHLRRGVKFLAGHHRRAFSANRVRHLESALAYRCRHPPSTYYRRLQAGNRRTASCRRSGPRRTTPWLPARRPRPRRDMRAGSPAPDRRPHPLREESAWWGKVEHNLRRVVFTPITSAPTRVAALLSGEVTTLSTRTLCRTFTHQREPCRIWRARAAHHLHAARSAGVTN